MHDLPNLLNYNLELNHDRQGKHIEGHKNYIPGKSVLTADPAFLLKHYLGNGEYVYTKDGKWANKERFSHTDIIGIWKAKSGTKTEYTNNGMFHYAKEKGVHIVPAEPDN